MATTAGTSTKTLAERAMEQGNGILRLAPAWVPRSFCIPGRRLKLHPDDYYALGAARGGIDERWFASTIPADNGSLTAPDEGLSTVVVQDGAHTQAVLLRDVIDELKGQVIGERLWNEYGRWPMFAKFFDNVGPLPFHIHQNDEHAAKVGALGKPEAYYFPPQLNNHGGAFPYTFLGLQPNVTKEQVREALVNFTKGDNKITNLSTAYRLEPGNAWDIPPSILHAPGSFCTYEPQRASDVFAMMQSLTGNQIVPEELLWKDVPEDRRGDFDYLLEIVDWEANLDPDFVQKRFMPRKPAHDPQESRSQGYEEDWICYKSTAFAAKELRVQPGKSVTIEDDAPYGFVAMQGHGTINGLPIETPTLIRFGQFTYDEYFVSEASAKAGVTIQNLGHSEPLVLLKHFGPTES